MPPFLPYRFHISPSTASSAISPSNPPSTTNSKPTHFTFLHRRDTSCNTSTPSSPETTCTTSTDRTILLTIICVAALLTTLTLTALYVRNRKRMALKKSRSLDMEDGNGKVGKVDEHEDEGMGKRRDWVYGHLVRGERKGRKGDDVAVEVPLKAFVKDGRKT